ncbi:wd repeat-containing protein 20 isoform x2 [Limosa lapponica baueri]|uniref:Wd repeat-containing protein 20 isoform x2 n=1 Tax=Limosa lapponica baueri TaxID=1758121 RepID=A0A2I0TIC2_LIMLA|nr:wd repeat-containing protein 20 isoform x2 [Limosa lapponica baueri]
MLLSKMAAEGGGKEMNEIKTQFTTREGLYKLLSHSEYSRPNRVPFNSQGSNPVRVSFVNVNDQSGNGDRLCFNVGRELYFYIYKGVRKVLYSLFYFSGFDTKERFTAMTVECCYKVFCV